MVIVLLSPRLLALELLAHCVLLCTAGTYVSH